MNHKINHANIKEWAKNYKGELFDGILCDPPYELGFMGKSWDSSGIAFDTEMWKDIYKLLKPGGHLLAFSGSRTYHRMACAIEDAGFEIRDMIEWVYGSGFPKSLNIGKAVDKLEGREREVVGKDAKPRMNNDFGKMRYNEREIKDIEITKGTSQWEGFGTALKPAHEPCVLARKPLDGTVANNVLKHGTGGLNIDGTRVGYGNESDSRIGTDAKAGGSQESQFGSFSNVKDKNIQMYKSEGRFPANLIHDGSDEVEAVFPNSKSTNNVRHNNGKQDDTRYGKYGAVDTQGYSDSGSASRFFFTAKPDLYCSLCYGIMEVCENNAPNAQKTSQLGTQANNTAQDNVAVKQVQEPKDRQPSKTNNAHNAVSSSANTNQTTENTAQQNVTQNLKELLDLSAKYAVSLCPKCQTSIAQKLVATATENMALQVCQDFMHDYKSSTQTESLVSTVAYLANIDITQTTINLMKLCGFAHLATDENTKQANRENDNGIYRLKYQSKASKSERNAGLEGLPKDIGVGNYMAEAKWINDPRHKNGGYEASPSKPQANHHPTVKPLSLTKYLATLIKPPTGGRLLVPFSGSGSEMIGALQAGWEYVEGVELTEEYIPIAEARIKYWLEQKEVEDNQPQQTALV